MAKKPSTPTPPRPVQAPKRRDDPKVRKPLDRRMLLAAAGVLVAAGVVAGLVVVLSGGSGGGKPEAVDWAALPGLQNGPPPWPNNSVTLADRLQPLGLSQLPQEGNVIHIHQHLDVYVNGKKVTVPAGIGIDASQTFLTELHSHAPDGIVHIESPAKQSFSLGQYFGEWGVRLTPTCIGSLCSKVSWWVDGVKQKGDPAALTLKAHQVIVLALGEAPKTIRKTYSWQGL